MVKNQLITDKYAIYNADCMEVLPTIPDESVDLSVYSPPFAGLYNYSSDPRDFSNCESKEQFLEQYDFLIKEMSRITKPGRITAVHCTDVFDNSCRLWDFPHEIIRIHDKYGFQYRIRVCVSPYLGILYLIVWFSFATFICSYFPYCIRSIYIRFRHNFPHSFAHIV